ncbi:MAG TPA: trypsin-like peptidase domain-containing protein [Kofleriaceae bacterium]
MATIVESLTDAQLRDALQPIRPAAWLLASPPGTAYRDGVTRLVDDAIRQRWVRDLVKVLRARAPAVPAFVQIGEALEHEIVDVSPYPFQLPMAQELIRVLAQRFRMERDATNFAEQFIDVLKLAQGQPPLNLWHDILAEAANAGATRALVQAVRDQQPNNPRVAFLDALLASQPCPVSAQPLAMNGAGFDDTVLAPEALLFGDDLTIPAGRVGNLIATLGKLTELAPAVCLLRVESVAGEFYGTGFRIAADRVLTNHHVAFPQGQAPTQIHADFGFDVDASGASLAVKSLSGDTASIVADQDDDWAVVRIADMDPAWPVIDLAAAQDPKPGDPAYILQHPNGQRKRLGFVRNTITDLDPRFVRYLTDTEPGSSGSPVFDASGRVIALHHKGGTKVTEVAGKPVTKNQGVLISRVREGLKGKGV